MFLFLPFPFPFFLTFPAILSVLGNDHADFETTRPQVSECAVVPIDSEKWGQKVAAVVVLTEEGKTAGKDGKPWSPLQMRQAMKERLVAYKIPQEMKIVEEIPRSKSYIDLGCVRYVADMQNRCDGED